MISFDLPWPSRILHPNSRPHWAEKAKAAKAARIDAAFIAKASGATQMAAERLSVSLLFAPPDNRRRDVDGCLSACKSALDGIADVIKVDDSKWELSIKKVAPVKGGNVRIEIQPIKETEHG